MSKLFVLSLFVLALDQGIFAQTNLEGKWEGNSICQIKSSPCHDEHVVYYVSKDSSSDSFEIIMYKIVNNTEDSIGALKFVFDGKRQVLSLADRGRQILWEFEFKDKTMHGTLMYKDQLYRIIDVKKR